MVMPYFGVEGGVNKYADLQASLGGVDVGNLSQYGLNIMGVGVVPLGLFDIYAKAGLQFINAKIALHLPDSSIVGNSEQWNTNFAFGFGAAVDFPLTPIIKLGMKAEYQHVHANKGVKTQFGPVSTSIDYPSNNIVFIAATVKFKGV